MALGKNLKKQQLIPDKGSKKTASSKKSSTKPTTRQKVLTPKKDQEDEMKLQHFITEQQLIRRTQLRLKYIAELAEVAEKQLQLIVFKIGNDEFAVSIDQVKEIIPTPEISKVPRMPSYIKGLIDNRGITTLVMDLGEKIGEKTQQHALFTLILLNQRLSIGLLLCELPRTLKIKGSEITGTIAAIEKATRDEIYIKGLFKRENKVIFLLDIAELINSDHAMVIRKELAD